jgi:hypothetical protein
MTEVSFVPHHQMWGEVVRSDQAEAVRGGWVEDDRKGWAQWGTHGPYDKY